MPAATRQPEPALTPASILAVLTAIEAHPADAPAAIAFRAALGRKGREAVAAGGPDAIAALLRQVAQVDPARAEARMVTLRGAWGDLPEWRS